MKCSTIATVFLAAALAAFLMEKTGDGIALLIGCIVAEFTAHLSEK